MLRVNVTGEFLEVTLSARAAFSKRSWPFVSAYNAQGQEIWRRDQATTGSNSDYNIIESDYDDAGRQTARRVTQRRTACDNAVLRIGTAYDALGRVETVTQYDAASSGNVVDQVKYVYDGWGNLLKFRQDWDGTVGTGSGFKEVVYAYEKATGGRNTLRRTSITLPDGAEYLFSYSTASTSHDADASRVTSIQDDAETDLVGYRYNGAGMVVGTDYYEPDVFSHLYDGTGTDFSSTLDRFGRVKRSRWTKDLSTDVDFVKVDVTYDPNSNVVAQDDLVHVGHDVLYANDGLNRLTGADEGTLSGSYPSQSISTRTRHQTWDSLTQTGNWATSKLDLDGDDNWNEAGELNETRVHNAVNELNTRDTDTDSSVDFTLAYDAAGNLTDDGENYTFVYDVFGRLRKVISRTSPYPLISEYGYNGLGYLVTRHQDTNSSGEVTATDKKFHTFYDERWRPVATQCR